MNILSYLKEKAKKNKRKIVLPESMDDRVLKAAEVILNEDIADIIIIGNEREILSKNYNLTKAKIIDPYNYNLSDEFINKLYELRKDKGMTLEKAKDLILNDYMYFSCMLLLFNMADGIVSGAIHSTSNTLRPALQLIKTKNGINHASSFFLMDIKNSTFIFADCGLIQYPTSEQLSEIAKLAADNYKLLFDKEPIIALLSHSTLGSAKHEEVDKVKNALKIFKNNYEGYKIEGELQLDAAIISDVAKIKAPNSEYAGKANILIFPNLDAGNIGYKLVERFADSHAYGPILQGLRYPVNDLSRGCSYEDIVGVIAITAIQSQEKTPN